MTQSAQVQLGQVVATPAALAALEAAGASAALVLSWHSNGDWGSVCAADARLNDEANTGPELGLLLSAYEVGSTRLWVISEADRSATTILLPEEY